MEKSIFPSRFCVGILLVVSLLGCSRIEERIDKVSSRVDDIENTQIASVKKQLASMDESVGKFEKTGSELKAYIETLQGTADELRKSISDSDAKIAGLEKSIDKILSEAKYSDSAVKDDLEKQIASAKTDVLAQLEAAKSSMESRLGQIEATIAALQQKDADLDKKIDDLRSYVDSKTGSETASAKDWASATFATLEQYNSLVSDISGIRGSIESLGESLSALEERLSGTVQSEVEKAIAPIKSQLTSDVASEVAKDYTAAIASARSEMEKAWKADIAKSISESEASMRTWINEALTGYSTIAATDAKIAALKNELEGELNAQKTYLEGLVDGLRSDMEQKTAANTSLITGLRSDLTSLQKDVADNTGLIGENSGAIKENAKSIEDNAGKIAANASAIAENAGKISDNAAAIRENSKSISQNAGDIAANRKLIDANKAAVDANAKLIAENSSALSALKTSSEAAASGNASAIAENVKKIAANAEAIAKNASAIQSNASLISANTSAISDNAAAIADNTTAIAQLRAGLETAKTELTEAYTGAIATAINTLDGKLSGEIAKSVSEVNARIDSEIESVNSKVDALSTRVKTLEADVKNIKDIIGSLRTDIEEINSKIDALASRIQSISYIPEYSDGRATVYYTNSAGTITPGSTTLRFEIQPSSVADALVEVWSKALSLKAVYTQTRASAGESIDLPISNVTASGGILTVTASGSKMGEEFFLGTLSANARLLVSSGSTQKCSEYVNLVPWTKDIILIPDANFKKYLVDNFDTDGDGEISEDEALAVKEIDVAASLSSISSLSGIGYFAKLEKLDCSCNRIAALDLSRLTLLKELNVSNNILTSIDLSGCVALTSIDCSKNRLQSLSVSGSKGLENLVCSGNRLVSLNIAQNKSLKTLDCSGNSLSTIDLSKAPSLTKLACGNNSIAALDLSITTALTELSCGGNGLTRLFLGNCSDLTSLDCSGNSLSVLDLSACKGIKSLNCSGNAIARLDVAALSALGTLNCSGNALTSLNVSTNASLLSLDCSSNSTLEKLYLKDAAQQNALEIIKDGATAILFNNGGINIPDPVLKAYLLENYDDDKDGEISIAEADNVTYVNCPGKGVKDITGLECCTNLVTVNCANNSIQEIDFHTLKKLSTLNCAGNPVKRLILDNCAGLGELILQGEAEEKKNAVDGVKISFDAYTQATSFEFSIRNTPFTSFSFTNAPSVASLVLDGDFTDVNISGNTAVTSADFSLLTSLANLDASLCSLKSLDMSKNMNLESLDCHGNAIASLDVSNSPYLVKLDCSSNALREIDVRRNTRLEDVNVSGNALSELNILNNTALRKLNLSGNSAVSLINLRNSSALEELNASGLSISGLDLNGIRQLKTLDVSDNGNLTRIVCPSQAWFDGMFSIIDRLTDVLFEDSMGAYLKAGYNVAVKLDENLWACRNAGYTSENKYGKKYDFASAQTACPEGWRTPTYSELNDKLSMNYSSETVVDGMTGRWFSGRRKYSSAGPAIFLPYLEGYSYGYYWSSSKSDDSVSHFLRFDSSSVYMNYDVNTRELSVRCIKE